MPEGRRGTYNFTMDNTVVKDARKRLEEEKKKDPKASLSRVLEEHLRKWSSKKK